MATALSDSPFLWGGMGALIYALPRLSACVLAARLAKASWWGCLFEAVIALLIGCIAAGAFGPWAAHFLKVADEAQTRAITASIGLMANPTAPAVIEVLSGRVLSMLRGPEK